MYMFVALLIVMVLTILLIFSAFVLFRLFEELWSEIKSRR